MINIIKNMIKMFTKEKPLPLGRWNMDCNKKTNIKIDASNRDHCGPCGEYVLNKIDLSNIKINIKK